MATNSETINTETLRQVAQELNEVLGLEPPIGLTLEEEELEEKLIEASALVEPGDEFSPGTWQVLEALGHLPPHVQEWRRGMMEESSSGAAAETTAREEEMATASAAGSGKGEKKKKEGKKKSGGGGGQQRSPFGHLLNRQSGRIDMLLLEGKHTVDEIAAELGVSKSRVLSHIRALRNKHVQVVKNEQGQLKIATTN